MPEVLAGIDLVVSRAGATTLAELTSLGIPSILIPSPYVTNNHQEKNARSLTNNGAATLLLEKDLNSKSLVNHIDQILLDQEKLKEMKLKAKSIGIPDAARRLYKLMELLVKGNQK
jgi:UDP-N-acetylglucosamine--N-acetylmuramyl-(pentapeptide) pyrophosphoryl-undecaprenol N-acetylglucosamine transferase